MTVELPASVLELEPAAVDDVVLGILRRQDRPVSVRTVADAIVAHELPRTSSVWRDRLLAVHAVVACVLEDLVHAGRVENLAGGDVTKYRAVCASDEVERRILALRRRLGGRPVEVDPAGGDNPTVTVSAPLDRLEGTPA